jgi:hypothetical protein
MTVAAVHEMSAGEYLRWGIYFGRKVQNQQLAEARWRL